VVNVVIHYFGRFWPFFGDFDRFSEILTDFCRFWPIFVDFDKGLKNTI
jgi:hypothetical protein